MYVHELATGSTPIHACTAVHVKRFTAAVSTRLTAVYLYMYEYCSTAVEFYTYMYMYEYIHVLASTFIRTKYMYIKWPMCTTLIW